MRDKVLIFRTSLYLDAQVRYTQLVSERAKEKKKKKRESDFELVDGRDRFFIIRR